MGWSAFANPVFGSFGPNTQATIQTPSPNNLIINQQSQKAIFNWQSFNINANESTTFNQPAGGIALNRISAQAGASQIYGRLTASGQIILINPAGIHFGPNAMVSVGGLIATTANLSDENFLNGHYVFGGGSNASIINEGTIIAAQHGLVALVGSNVSNSGKIEAELGHIVLASGDTFTMSLAGDDLVNFAVSQFSPNRTSITNTGSLIANGGHILITASQASGMLDNVINLQGVMQAQSVYAQNGEIVISANPHDGEVHFKGSADVSGSMGGNVSITGFNILLGSQSLINASGTYGGGNVFIGGNMHGQGDLPNANAVVMEPNANILADAITTGNGGTVVLWSNNVTKAYGNISAKGGSQGGNGGYVETSGHYLDVNGITVDTSAPKGTSGTWLLDPTNIYIAASQANATTAGMSGTDTSADSSGPPTFAASGAVQDSLLLTATLNAALVTNDVLVTTTNASGTGTGFIDVVDSVTNTSGHSLSLIADTNISINAGIALGGSSTLVLNAGGTISQNSSAAITGNGGLTLQSGTFTMSASNNYTGITNIDGGVLKAGAANVFSSNSSVQLTNIAGATLDLNSFSNTIGYLSGGGAAGGNVILGTNANKTLTINFGGTVNYLGIISGNGGLTKSGSGTINLSGANTYTGLTIIRGGTLQLGNNNVIADSSEVRFLDIGSTASAFDLNGYSETIGGLSGGISGSNVGKVLLGTGTLTVNGNTTYSGDMSGTGGNLVVGSGLLQLTGNNSYSGTTNINSGATLIAGSNTALGTGTVTVVSGGTLSLGNGVTINNALNLNGSGIGSVGALNSAGSSVYAGPITLGSDSTLSITLAGTLTLNNTVSGASENLYLGGFIDPGSSFLFNDTVNVKNIITAASNYNIAFNGSNTTFADAVTFNNTGSLALGNGASILSFVNGLTATAPSQVSVAGTILSTAGDINLSPTGGLVYVTTNTSIGGSSAGQITLGNTQLLDNTTLTFEDPNNLPTRATNMSIVLGTVYGSTLGNITSLVFNTANTIQVNGSLAMYPPSQPFRNFTIENSAGATFNGPVATTFATLYTAGSIATGNITFNDYFFANNITTANQFYSLSFLGTTSYFGATTEITSAANFLNTGFVTLGNGSNSSLLFDNGISTTGNASNPTSTSIYGSVLSNGGVMAFGPVSLNGNSTLDTTLSNVTPAGANLTVGNVTSNGNALTLNAGTGGLLNAQGFSGGGDLTIANTLQATISGVINAGTLTLTNAVGPIVFSNDVTATTFNTGSNPFSFYMQGTNVNITDPVTLNNTGNAEFGAFPFSLATLAGGLTANASTTLYVVGTLQSNGAAIINPGETIANSASAKIATNNGFATGAAISLGSIDSVGSGDTLTLDAGTNGAISVSSNFINGGSLSILNAGSAIFSGSINANIITLPDVPGGITFNGSLTATQLDTAAGAYNIVIDGASNTITNAVNFQNTGTVTLGNIIFTGGVNTTTTSGTILDGNVSTNSTALVFGTTTVNGNATLASAGGNLSIGAADSSIAGSNSLTLNAGSGVINFGVIGGGTPLNTFAVGTSNAGGLSITNNITTTGGTTLTNNNGIVQETGGAVINGGVLTISSVGGTTLNNANTVSGFSASNTGSGNVSFTNAGALNIDGIYQPVGSVTINNTTGAITQSGAIIAGNGGSFNAGLNSIVLNNTGNSFGGSTLLLNGSNMNLAGGVAVSTLAATGSAPSGNSFSLNINGAPQFFVIGSANGGTVTANGWSGGGSFSNIQNLIGGSSGNTFIFPNGMTFNGHINGDVDPTNTLNFSAFTTGINVNLTGATINGFTGTTSGPINPLLGGFENINNIVNGSGGGTLTAPGFFISGISANGGGTVIDPSNPAFQLTWSGFNATPTVPPTLDISSVIQQGALTGAGTGSAGALNLDVATNLDDLVAQLVMDDLLRLQKIKINPFCTSVN